MADGEVDHEGIARAAITQQYGTEYVPPTKFVATVVEALHNLEAHYGEDVPEATGDEIVDLDAAYELLSTVRQDLVDQALGGNIARKHHLETAVAVFADIGVLLRAEEIIRELFDPREESDDAVSEDDHGADSEQEPS